MVHEDAAGRAFWSIAKTVDCAIGQRASAIAKTLATLREQGALDYTLVVVTEGNDAPGLINIAPYAATSIADQSHARSMMPTR